MGKFKQILSVKRHCLNINNEVMMQLILYISNTNGNRRLRELISKHICRQAPAFKVFIIILRHIKLTARGPNLTRDDFLLYL